jgi:hypothetical protein
MHENVWPKKHKKQQKQCIKALLACIHHVGHQEVLVGDELAEAG